MKSNQKPSVIKLVARFDKELKNILLNDLKAAKALKNQFNQSLHAA